MRFADIVPYTRSANYQITVDWKYLETTLENYDEKRIPGFIFDMDPDFQRGHVWDVDQQRRYVEYILPGRQELQGHHIQLSRLAGRLSRPHGPVGREAAARGGPPISAQ